jgi:hypothetical protein
MLGAQHLVHYLNHQPREGNEAALNGSPAVALRAHHFPDADRDVEVQPLIFLAHAFNCQGVFSLLNRDLIPVPMDPKDFAWENCKKNLHRLF